MSRWGGYIGSILGILGILAVVQSNLYVTMRVSLICRKQRHCFYNLGHCHSKTVIFLTTSVHAKNINNNRQLSSVTFICVTTVHCITLWLEHNVLFQSDFSPAALWNMSEMMDTSQEYTDQTREKHTTTELYSCIQRLAAGGKNWREKKIYK